MDKMKSNVLKALPNCSYSDITIPVGKENYERFYEIKKNLTEVKNIEDNILDKLGQFSNNLLKKTKEHEAKKEGVGHI